MGNLRISKYEVVDSANVKFIFKENLNNNVVVSNVEITTLSVDVATPQVLKTTVFQNELNVTTTPLVPYAIYKFALVNTQTNRITNTNGTNILFVDGKTNAPFIAGPVNPANNVLQRTLTFLKDTPYNTEPGSLIRTHLESMSDALYKAQNTIYQLRTDNYLSITVTDEYHTRGKGPYDRLDNEGAYEIIRVGKNPQDTLVSGSLSVDNVTNLPIALQTKKVSTESLTFSATSIASSFNGRLCSLLHDNVTKVTAITIVYANATVVEYDINAYGYQIKDSRYDNYASSYVTLETNQFRFSEKSIAHGLQLPTVGDTVYVDYEYKDTGVYIDPDSVEVFELKQAIREVAPPIATVFSLENSNVVSSTGNTVTLNGVSFLDPYAIPPYSASHPAFVTEKVHDGYSMPLSPGYYIVDYSSGKVFVFGSDGEYGNEGTTSYPPVCTYYYKKEYTKDIDYTYEPTLLEVAINPERDLLGKDLIISFQYSQNYTPDVDFKPQVHNEVLNERINNNIRNVNVIKTQHSPITNVFRIFNETTGEVYRLSNFNNNEISFNYNRYPNAVSIVKERAQFQSIFEETLLKTQELTNSYSAIIFEIDLSNNNIINGTEDGIGSYLNTSLIFNETSLFVKELYFERETTLAVNLDKLGNTAGRYVVDYVNGIIYVCVSSSILVDLGTVTYKSKFIETKQTHILNVLDVYTQVDNSSTKNKFTYNTVSDTLVDLTTYDYSDNKYVSEEDPQEIIFVTSHEISLPRNALSVRAIYETTDIDELSPINFAVNSITTNSACVLGDVEFKENSTITGGGNIAVPRVQNNSYIELNGVISVKRISDGAELYNTTLSNGSYTGYTITLPTDTVGSIGEAVEVSVFVNLADVASVICDINYGGLFIDYTYLFDEVLVSYEYGDNCLDFTDSTTILEGQKYFVSYKYGALRDGLLKNFGSCVDIDELKNFDIDLERERYRDALLACFQSFPKGPTKTAIKEIVKNISHIYPNIIESLFEQWVVGYSHLKDNPIAVTGEPELRPAVFDYGIYFDNNDSIEVPVCNHIKMDNGTLEFWTIPNWDGIDNDATLEFSILKNGAALPSERIWIGADGYNPTISSDNKFSVNRYDIPSPNGLPSNVVGDGYGAFIYYDVTASNWKLLVKDITDYSVYNVTVDTTGEFYNIQNFGTLIESSDVRRSTNSRISLTLTLDAVDIADGYDGYSVDGYDRPYSFDGITFMSDDTHYLFDYGEVEDENRISIFKDGQGYLNLRVYSKKDRFGKSHYYQLSHDISDWKKGDSHHVAISNILNSYNKKDELHLFVDGSEVYNLLKYGGRPQAALTDRFRTVAPELMLGTIPSNTVAGNDLVTVLGSDEVTTSSVDFGIYGITAGDTIYIEESGFSSYTILSVIDFHTLQLDSAMPASITGGVFTVNKYSMPVSTNLIYESNIVVTKYDGATETELPGLRCDVPAYGIEVDGYGNSSIVIRSEAEAGDQIYIRTLGMNHRRVRERIYNWEDSDKNFINLNLPPPINLDYVSVKRVVKDKTLITSSTLRSNGQIQYTSFTKVGNNITVVGVIPDGSPKHTTGGWNSTSGVRTLDVTISGDNVDFNTPVTITINGVTSPDNSTFSSTSETLTFSDYGTLSTSYLYYSVATIDVAEVVLNANRSSLSFEIKEKYDVRYTELNNDLMPITIRNSFIENVSTKATSSGDDIITCSDILFYESDIGKKVTTSVIPGELFEIIDVVSSNVIQVDRNIVSVLSNSNLNIYNIGLTRSGYQNGKLIFEHLNYSTVFNIGVGFWDVDYSTSLYIPFELRSSKAVFGNNILKTKPANAIIDEIRALDYISVDTRVGESLPSIGRSITTDYNSVKVFEPDVHTLLLLHMDELPPVDSSMLYQRYSRDYYQAASSVNSEFGESLYIKDKAFVIDNDRIITGNSGTIEFWVNSDIETQNDPFDRYLFDASSSIVENITSTTKVNIVLPSNAKQVLSVRLKTDKNSSGINYAIGGTLSADKKSFSLGLALPYSQTPVVVSYIPYGVFDNRISILKTKTSSIVFSIISDNKEYKLETPVFWSRDTWHRVMATWDFNTPRAGQMHLFVDGQERVFISAGTIVAGGVVAGAVVVNYVSGINVNIKDQFQKLHVGSNYLGGQLMQCKIDNLKISNKLKAAVTINGQTFDNDYNSNLESVLPVVPDLYTTYLSDFNKETIKIGELDLATLRNPTTGIFDFKLNVLDSFDIINDDARIKSILEKLIQTLKPANSRAFIKYV